ncbi:protein sister of odd and bowel-like [Gigantopelta aegis]|uniref:protein sister of odd and bowel-like n=1 Tax=Gigantopelta aegis TaxID=1735272 RepID=UPI001B888858|nr:protein sister of odd and bowel-like [Gigantopelta aegis]
MSGIYSNEQDRCHINPYANQPPSSDPVIFTSPAQWKTFPVEKQGHVTSPHNNHAVMTTATLGSSHGNQVMVNLEPKSLHNYAAYYPPWSATGPLHLPAVGGHGSFGQMLGTVDPPRVCVPVSAPLNRQDIIPVVANVNHAGSAVNMAPVHVGRDGSVAMAASHRQEMDGASMVVAHMPGAMQKEYWPSAVSSMHAENIIANSGLVASAGQTSYSVLGSVTSCSYASAGSVMSQLENSKFQPTRDRSPIYQAGLQEAVVPSSCGKVVKEMTYSIPTASQSYPDVTSSGASMNEATLHQSYHKTVTSSNVTDNQTVDSSHHEDIVAKALSQSLNSDSDVTGHYGNSIQFGDVRQTFSTVDKPVQFASDLCNSVNNSSYGSTVRQDFVSSEQKPGRRGPGRPPGSAVSGDDDHKSKPYECEYCERRFKHTQQRRVHVMSHTGERPHVCPYCQKGFKTLAQKTDHIRVHTGDKPYKCTSAGASSASTPR